jgi:UDP-glucose 4-epimerase
MSRNLIVDSVVLVTGGTGSFGQTVVKRLLDQGAGEVRILSRDEAKQDDLRHRLSDSRARFYIGDVRDFDSVHRASRDVDYVFHAAALKQVPSSEFFPVEAVKTNVLGTANVVQAAEASRVKTVILLSTDKAVYPVNAMGQSKALAEKVAQSHGLNSPNAATTVAITRYGNVLYSRGSVVPLFVSQIKAGRNLTVTNPQMTRFLMTLSDSVDLVEYAFTNANQGDLFIRKTVSTTIQDLAQALINLFQSNVGIEIIGTRHAEKVSEALASSEELSRAEDLGDYYRVRADKRDLNYDVYFSEGDLHQVEFADYDSHTVQRLGVTQVEELLLTVPEVRRDLALAGLTERLEVLQHEGAIGVVS